MIEINCRIYLYVMCNFHCLTLNFLSNKFEGGGGDAGETMPIPLHFLSTFDLHLHLHFFFYIMECLEVLSSLYTAQKKPTMIKARKRTVTTE
jgi:hypothetical protein